MNAGYHKEGMHLMLQKFQKSERQVQALLGECDAHCLSARSDIEVSGFDFNSHQHRALTALNLLLDRTDFKGNIAPTPDKFHLSFRFRGPLPNLKMEYPEYFEAYGLSRTARRAFHGKGAQDALEALRSLSDPWTIAYAKKNGAKRNGQLLNDVVVTRKPLIGITKFYRDVPETEVEKLRANKQLDVRVTNIVVDFSPLWVDGIGAYYLQKPVTLYKEIRQLHHGRRFSEAIYAFCDWLLTLDISSPKINELNLEHKLWLDRHRKQGHTGRSRKILDDAYETARQVGLLKSYGHGDFGHGDFGLLKLELNPQICRRIRLQRSQPIEAG